MQTQGEARPSGVLGLTVHRGNGRVEQFPGALPEPSQWPTTLKLEDILEHGYPQKTCSPEVNVWRKANRRNLHRRLKKVQLAKLFKLPTVYGALFLEKTDGRTGERIPYGLASVAVVTTAGVNFIVDAFQNIVELEIMNFHGFGTGGAAEAVGNTALTTELTTQYATDNVRPTGTQSEAAANIYQTVGTLDPDADVAITEHGIFSVATSGSGVLLDRSLFSVINLVGATGDSLAATYQFTVTSGG
jgi:hypothetical protein